MLCVESEKETVKQFKYQTIIEKSNKYCYFSYNIVLSRQNVKQGKKRKHVWLGVCSIIY